MAYKQKKWTPFTSIPEKKKVGPVADNPKPKEWTGSDEDYQKHFDEVDAYNRKVDIERTIDDAHGKTTIMKGRKPEMKMVKRIKPTRYSKDGRRIIGPSGDQKQTKKAPKDIVRTNKP